MHNIDVPRSFDIELTTVSLIEFTNVRGIPVYVVKILISYTSSDSTFLAFTVNSPEYESNEIQDKIGESILI